MMVTWRPEMTPRRSVTETREEGVLRASCAAPPHLRAIGRSCWLFPIKRFSAASMHMPIVFASPQSRTLPQAVTVLRRLFGKGGGRVQVLCA